MPRKTVAVLQMLEYANIQLARTDKFVTKEYKEGIVTMIEKILHDTGNYAGFSFVDNDDSDCGTLGYYSRQYYYSVNMRREYRNSPAYDGRFGRRIDTRMNLANKE